MNKVARQNFHTTDKSSQTEPKSEVRWGENPPPWTKHFSYKLPTIVMSLSTFEEAQDEIISRPTKTLFKRKMREAQKHSNNY